MKVGSEAGARVYQYADGLCTALQIVNHLQDCGKDLMTMDRCYLPGDWLEEVGASVADLRGPALTDGLRSVLDRLLDDVDAQLARAAHLPRALTSRRLAMESEIIIRLARRLATRLRKGDPLATRVKLTKPDFFVAGLVGTVCRVCHRRPRQASAGGGYMTVGTANAAVLGTQGIGMSETDAAFHAAEIVKRSGDVLRSRDAHPGAGTARGDVRHLCIRPRGG